MSSALPLFLVLFAWVRFCFCFVSAGWGLFHRWGLDRVCVLWINTKSRQGWTKFRKLISYLKFFFMTKEIKFKKKVTMYKLCKCGFYASVSTLSMSTQKIWRHHSLKKTCKWNSFYRRDLLKYQRIINVFFISAWDLDSRLIKLAVF